MLFQPVQPDRQVTFGTSLLTKLDGRDPFFKADHRQRLLEAFVCAQLTYQLLGQANRLAPYSSPLCRSNYSIFTHSNDGVKLGAFAWEM